MNDPFARTTATQAHQRATEALALVTKVDQGLRLAGITAQEHAQITTDIVLSRKLNRRPEMIGRCALCGDTAPRASNYCRAHSWAKL